MRRSQYKFSAVTPAPKNVIDVDNAPFSEIIVLMRHAVKNYKNRASKCIEEIRDKYPEIRIFIKK